MPNVSRRRGQTRPSKFVQSLKAPVLMVAMGLMASTAPASVPLPTAICTDISVQLDSSGSAFIVGSDVDGGSLAPNGLQSLEVTPDTFSCADIGPQLVTLTITDILGEFDSCQATVTVEDTEAPNAQCQTTMVELDETGVGYVYAPEIDGGSTDNCAIDFMTVQRPADRPTVGTLASAPGRPKNAEGTRRAIAGLEVGCADVGNLTVELQVWDVSGNSSTCQTTVTVADIIPPMALCRNIDAYLGADGTVTITAAEVDDGSVDACGIAEMTLSQEVFNCANLGPNTVTLTVKDVNGNESSCESTVTVIDDTPPDAVAKASITAFLDGSGTVHVFPEDMNDGSSDNCDLTLSLELPATMRPGAEGRGAAVSGLTFGCADIGSNQVVLRATDGSGNSSTSLGTVFVEDATPPNVVVQNITVSLNPSGEVTVNATDLDNGTTDNCGAISYYGITPPGMTRTVSEPSSITFTCDDIGSNDVLIHAYDQFGNSASASATVTVEDPLSVCGGAPVPPFTIFAARDTGFLPIASILDPLEMPPFRQDFLAFDPGFSGGVRVATGDVSGDGVADLIVGAGPGGAPHVRVFDGGSLAPISEFFGFGGMFTGGIYVAGGDVDGDSLPDIVVGSGAGATATVAVYSFAAGTSSPPDQLMAFLPYDAFAGGVRVAVGDIDNDGFGDIITGAGPGAGPHVKVFSGADNSQLRSFFAFDAGFMGGVTVAAADMNSDGSADVIVGAGPGGAPHVKVFDGLTGSEISSFFAYAPTFTGGVNVGAGDVNGDGLNDIIVGAATVSFGPPRAVGERVVPPDPFPPVTAFNLDGSMELATAALDAAPVGTFVAGFLPPVEGDTIPPMAACQDITVQLDLMGNRTIMPGEVDGGSTDNVGITSMQVVPDTFGVGDIGPNMVTLTVFDAEGNSASCMATVTVEDMPGDPDMTAPSGSIVDVAPSIRNTPVDSIDVLFDEPVDLVDVTDFVLRRGTTVLDMSGASIAGGPVLFNVSGLAGLTGAHGNYTFELLPGGIEDAAGNVLATGDTTLWKVDVRAAKAVIKSLAPTQVGDMITGRVISSDSGAAGVASTQLFVRRAGGVWTEIMLPANGQFSYMAPEGSGVYYFVARAVDNLGNASAPDPVGTSGKVKGQKETHHNTVENGAFPHLYQGTNLMRFPMDNSGHQIEVRLVSFVLDGIDPPTITAQRIEGPVGPGFIDEMYTFTTTGFSSIRVKSWWAYDPANSNGLAVGDIDTMIQTGLPSPPAEILATVTAGEIFAGPYDGLGDLTAGSSALIP